MDNCPVSGKPCSKYKGFNVAEKTGSKVNNYIVCEDCLFNNQNSKLSIVQEDIACTCGTKLSGIMKGERIGCAKCYDFFEDMKYIISSIQNLKEPMHTGRSPVLWKMQQAESTTCSQFFSDVQNKIKTAVQKEDYKKAIWLRDQIKKFQEIEVRYIQSNDQQSPLIKREIVEFIYEFRENENNLF
jgi:protein-arginine kinase activator protein McsA